MRRNQSFRAAEVMPSSQVWEDSCDWRVVRRSPFLRVCGERHFRAAEIADPRGQVLTVDIVRPK